MFSPFSPNIYFHSQRLLLRIKISLKQTQKSINLLQDSNHDLHIPIVNLTLFQHGIKIYNQLPLPLKELSNDIPKFKAALHKFLLENSFYTLEEYYNWK